MASNRPNSSNYDHRQHPSASPSGHGWYNYGHEHHHRHSFDWNAYSPNDYHTQNPYGYGPYPPSSHQYGEGTPPFKRQKISHVTPGHHQSPLSHEHYPYRYSTGQIYPPYPPHPPHGLHAPPPPGWIPPPPPGWPVSQPPYPQAYSTSPPAPPRLPAGWNKWSRPKPSPSPDPENSPRPPFSHYNKELRPPPTPVSSASPKSAVGPPSRQFSPTLSNPTPRSEKEVSDPHPLHEELKDHEWDFHDESYFFEEDEPINYNLSLGIIAWRPGKIVGRLLPATFAEAGKDSHELQVEQPPTGSVSKYVNKGQRLHCRPIRDDKFEWLEVQRDPMFANIIQDNDMVPVERAIANAARPAKPTAKQSKYNFNDHLASCTGGVKVAHDDERYSPPPANVPLPKLNIATPILPMHETTSMETSSMSSNMTDIEKRKSSNADEVLYSSKRVISEDSKSELVGSIDGPIPAAAGKAKHRNRKDVRLCRSAQDEDLAEKISTEHEISSTNDKALEETLARLGVTGTPKPVSPSAFIPYHAFAKIRPDMNSPNSGTSDAAPKAEGTSGEKHFSPKSTVKADSSFEAYSDVGTFESPNYEKGQQSERGTDLDPEARTEMVNINLDTSLPFEGTHKASEKIKIETSGEGTDQKDNTVPESTEHQEKTSMVTRSQRSKRPHDGAEPVDKRKRQKDDVTPRLRSRQPKVDAAYSRRW